jgi:hypothetical protein
MRRAMKRAAKAPEVTPAKVIGHDEDEVWSLRSE